MKTKTKEELLSIFRDGTTEEAKAAQEELEARMNKISKQKHSANCLCSDCQKGED